jgi:hypothetical protein
MEVSGPPNWHEFEVNLRVGTKLANKNKVGRLNWEKLSEPGQSWRWLGDPGSEKVLRAIFSRCSLPFSSKSGFKKPLPPRGKHAQCVKKFRFFPEFLKPHHSRTLTFEEVFDFSLCAGRDGTTGDQWHGFGY